jgi:hypothetical protein
MSEPGPGVASRYLEGAEGVFVACSFWLAERLARQGRTAQALTHLSHITAAVALAEGRRGGGSHDP